MISCVIGAEQDSHGVRTGGEAACQKKSSSTSGSSGTTSTSIDKQTSNVSEISYQCQQQAINIGRKEGIF